MEGKEAEATVEGKEVHADTFDGVEGGHQSHSSSRGYDLDHGSGAGSYERDHHGHYIDEFESDYSENKHNIYRNVDSTAFGGKHHHHDSPLHYEHIKDSDFETADDDGHFSGMTEEQWKEREEKERRNLEEL